MTNKERLDVNNEKIKEIQETLKNKILDGLGDGEYFVKVIDYDGTILKEANLNTGDTFTLPKAPSHDGLVFQEWSCSQDIVDNAITIEDNNVMVGATYTTASGLNEFDIEVTKVTGLDVSLNMDGTKDWGDGTSDDLTAHTYSDYGKYTIKCNGTTINGYLFKQSSGVNQYVCTNIRIATCTTLPTNCITKCKSLSRITLSNNLTQITDIVFSECSALKTIIVPNSVTKIGNNFLTNCYSLNNVVITKNVSNIGSYLANGCTALTNIALPKNITIKGYAIQSCKSLSTIIMPQSITSLSDKWFAGCGLTYVKIPSSVTNVGYYSFENCTSLLVYDFSNCNQIPTLYDTKVFTGINAIAKIIVPDELYDEWIVATNWATYDNYIYKASEVQS